MAHVPLDYVSPYSMRAKRRCAICGNIYQEYNNIGTWSCAFHPLPLTADDLSVGRRTNYRTGYFYDKDKSGKPVYDCCGQGQYSKGCVPCDHCEHDLGWRAVQGPGRTVNIKDAIQSQCFSRGAKGTLQYTSTPGFVYSHGKEYIKRYNTDACASRVRSGNFKVITILLGFCDGTKRVQLNDVTSVAAIAEDINNELDNNKHTFMVAKDMGTWEWRPEFSWANVIDFSTWIKTQASRMVTFRVYHVDVSTVTIDYANVDANDMPEENKKLHTRSLSMSLYSSKNKGPLQDDHILDALTNIYSHRDQKVPVDKSKYSGQMKESTIVITEAVKLEKTTGGPKGIGETALNNTMWDTIVEGDIDWSNQDTGSMW